MDREVAKWREGEVERIASGGMIATSSVEVESWTETDTTGGKKRVLREETKERKKERKREEEKAGTLCAF